MPSNPAVLCFFLHLKGLTKAICLVSIISLVAFSMPAVVAWRSPLIMCFFLIVLLLWKKTKRSPLVKLDICEQLLLMQMQRELIFPHSLSSSLNRNKRCPLYPRKKIFAPNCVRCFIMLFLILWFWSMNTLIRSLYKE